MDQVYAFTTFFETSHVFDLLWKTNAKCVLNGATQFLDTAGFDHLFPRFMNFKVTFIQILDYEIGIHFEREIIQGKNRSIQLKFIEF